MFNLFTSIYLVFLNFHFKHYGFHFLEFQLVSCHTYTWFSPADIPFLLYGFHFVDAHIYSTSLRTSNLYFNAVSDWCIISSSLGIYSSIFQIYWMSVLVSGFFIHCGNGIWENISWDNFYFHLFSPSCSVGPWLSHSDTSRFQSYVLY